MTKTLVLWTLMLSLAACGCPQHEAPAPTAEAKPITKESLRTLDDKINYAVAYDVGRSITRNGLKFDDAIFQKGVKDGMDESEETALLDEQNRLEVKREHSMERRKVEQADREKQAGTNQAEAETFLAENKTKEGIAITESGLQYQILTPGTGATPAAEDRVSVHYRGILLDGTEFDSSYSRNQPATFPVNRVVPGWTEALQLMPVGSKWKLFLPPSLAYGERGAGGKIGPNAALIFEVELLEILAAEDTPKKGN